MIKYVKVDKISGKRPVSVRVNPIAAKPEYCFGLNVWRASIRLAWGDFQEAQRPKFSEQSASTTDPRP